MSEKKKERYGIFHIYTSDNNTIITVTDITGAEILYRISGGMVVRADRAKASPEAAIMMSKMAIEEAKNKGITAIHIKIRAPGGHEGPWLPWTGGRAAYKFLTRGDLKVGYTEDVTPIPHDRCRRRGGRRGRRM